MMMEKYIIHTPKGNEFTEVPSDKRDEQKLSGAQIVELGKICIGIEKHYGFPCDIEWGMEKNKFYITKKKKRGIYSSFNLILLYKV